MAKLVELITKSSGPGSRLGGSHPSRHSRVPVLRVAETGRMPRSRLAGWVDALPVPATRLPAST